MNQDLRVRDIGENALIERLRDVLVSQGAESISIELGIGDDAAIWRPSSGHEIVVTSDTLVERVHFRLDWTDWKSLGHKMLAVNLSDIAAMGASPKLVTVALGLTGNELVSDVEQLYQGAQAIAASYGVAIAGGDIVLSPGGMMLGITALGEVPVGKAIRRSGARPGDLIVVSGTLGASAAGLMLLAGQAGSGTTGELLIAAHLRPVPRVALGRLLFDAGATAAMDLSDGLMSDLPRLAKASGVSAEIGLERIPIAPAVHALFPDRWQELALHGGEDYELLLTVPENRFDALRQQADEIGATLTSIGRIVEKDEAAPVRLLHNGSQVEVDLEAFRRSGRVNIEDDILK